MFELLESDNQARELVDRLEDWRMHRELAGSGFEPPHTGLGFETDRVAGGRELVAGLASKHMHTRTENQFLAR